MMLLALSLLLAGPRCRANNALHACDRRKDLRGIRFLQKAGVGGQGKPQKKTGVHGVDKRDLWPPETKFHFLSADLHHTCAP